MLGDVCDHARNECYVASRRHIKQHRAGTISHHVLKQILKRRSERLRNP